MIITITISGRRCSYIRSERQRHMPKRIRTKSIHKGGRDEHSRTHHVNQVEYWRVGDWPDRIPDLPRFNLCQSPGIVATRTDTDARVAEWRHVTTLRRPQATQAVHTRLQKHPEQVPEVETQRPMHGRTDMHNPTDQRDYYRFEWFRILVAFITLAIFGTGISPATVLGNIVKKFGLILKEIAGGLLTLCAYTCFFLVLSRYHNKISRLLERYLLLPPGAQKVSLRICTYLYAGAFLTMVVFPVSIPIDIPIALLPRRTHHTSYNSEDVFQPPYI